MNSEEKKRELAVYRIRQAEETLDEAKFLLSGGKSLRSVVNRVYYSMFYAVLGLFIFEKYSSSKHVGIISYFNQHFIKTGIFPKELGWAFNRAFDLRQRGDYKEYVSLTHEQVKPVMDAAEIFIDTVKKHLQQRNLI